MTGQSPNTTEQIKVLEAEESILENKTTHKGFRNAGCRNRIQEQLKVLHEAARHAETYDIEVPSVNDVREKVK
ncbi:MAG: hypothetical protein ABI197_14235 [Granulicella sp.]